MQIYQQDIEKLLEEGNSIQIKPQGYSMYPFLVPGRDEVVVAPITAETGLKRGDVVLYRRIDAKGNKGILVLHRIWKRTGNVFYLVGDNQKEIEGPLERNQIKGIMTEFIRHGKKISVRNPLYKALSGIWLFFRPLRPMISKIGAKIGVSKIL